MAPDTAKTEKPVRKRLSAEARREQIITAAISLFAENGFESSTHQLAQSIGVTQPLIYRHFPTKDDLVKAVYERVFLSEWRSSWDVLLSDRTQPITHRLARFYVEYTEKIFQSDWIRIYLFAGLKRLEINRWYIALVEDRVLGRIAAELRAEYGLKSPDEVPVTALETEALWVFHGGIFYYGVRQGVYGTQCKVSREELVHSTAQMVVDAMGTVMRSQQE